ncbi:Nitrilotriacetate monooxygenase component A/pristinamycin IIA synthase subunit A [Melanomma pulvis-pyrius CBS 109.77]|uniref:Nitrilotriacetate monooxygenase component A/pristinamycin IIA synthase subunit A n=1 Tax=Melanomma pulvis-pyrius CBS 109.77 TaxID=1314802 RepID=A0A6A6WXW7_9PLEO|nr:Nitrilotriacetate monooxygenase component A/pristinamycin IIA synthase subunit A [Melanomma pulvis-pyrius CBS 109.77]
MSSADSPAANTPLNVLQGTAATPQKYGYKPDGSKKRILLNAFDMNGIGHISAGQWRNPVDKSQTKNRLDYWIHLAKLLDRNGFNALFLADNFGSHDVYTGSHAPAIRAGSQWPLYDPFVIVCAMAAVTKSVAFGITACTTFEPPFILAKRFSTLDHVTNGRIAWNVVTSWSDNAARAMGMEKLPEHDLRYEIADEYLSLMYNRLWEGSWADDAVVKDTANGIFADPSKVRKIVHHGQFFKSESAHQVDPSPQRTPVIFQAGMSPAGAKFGAKHAECIFMGGMNPAIVAGKIAKTRELAKEQGRDPDGIKFFIQFTPIIAATDEEAQAKLEHHRQHAIPEGGLALFAGISGIDVSQFGLDEEFPTDLNDPRLERFAPGQRERLVARPRGYTSWTPRILGQYQTIGGSGNFYVGSGKTIADRIEEWITQADVDGFNIGHVAVPQAWEDVVEFLLPELKKRGWLGDGGYPVPGGTARENLNGKAGASRLDDSHPGSSFKFEVWDATKDYIGREEEKEDYVKAA